MAGIYIHIPFCKKACSYCDFHFSTSLRNKEELIASLILEIESRVDYLNGQPIETIYFGGGTPSLLDKEEISRLINSIQSKYKVNQGVEITLEANPDDLTELKLKELKEVGINRLSIGIQSFVERDLKFMNRSHSMEQSLSCVEKATLAGFNAISIDLIYGIPNLSPAEWKQNISKALSLNVTHISAYCLTSEEKTKMHYDIKNGKYSLPNDDITTSQFQVLVSELANHGFEQYEISNFCKSDQLSQHNSSYWKQKSYLGIGPSAHSFDGKSRRWNVANNAKYILGAKNGKWCFEEEKLDAKTKFNEYIMTSLRTKWGVDLAFLKTSFDPVFISHFEKESSALIKKELIIQSGTQFTLSPTGKLLADRIASELFLVD